MRIHNIVSGVFFLLIVTGNVDAASFDCSKANTKTEKVICGDSILSKLDEDMAVAYTKALKTSDRDAVRKGQRTWLKEVLAPCIEDKACIKEAYENRLRQLGFPAFAGSFSEPQPTPSRNSNTSPETEPLACPQCGLWRLSYSEPDGLVGDIVFVDEHQIVIPECGVFNYKVEKSETTVEREGSIIYNLSFSLSSRGDISPLCTEEDNGPWQMDIKVHGLGSADLVLSNYDVNRPVLWLVGWNIDREGPCDWGGGEDTARCERIDERIAFKILSRKVEQAYEKLLRTSPSAKLPSFNAALFSATVAKFCENKERDSGGAGWPNAWAFRCQNRILKSKLKDFSLWNECVKNKHKTCIFPTENFDRSSEPEAGR